MKNTEMIATAKNEITAINLYRVDEEGFSFGQAFAIELENKREFGNAVGKCVAKFDDYDDAESFFDSLLKKNYIKEARFFIGTPDMWVTIKTGLMTEEAIDSKRDEARTALENGTITEEEFNAEYSALYEASKTLEKLRAIAMASNENIDMFVIPMYECGWWVEYKVNGEWETEEIYTLEATMKRFAQLAREYNVKTCNVSPSLLDKDEIKKKDREQAKYERESAYADACMTSFYGDDSLMRSYEREYGIEKDYGPSNPWDAPGMKISDFIKGVY